MRPIRRTLAIDASIVVLAAASVAELWIGHRADATMVTALLAVGTSASLLTWRSSPVAAVVAASAAQAALLGEMPRPMISSVVALAATAVIAGASAGGSGGSVGSARTHRWAAGIGPIAAILVAADYAFRIRTSGQGAAFGIVVASLAVFWAFGHWVVRRLTAPPAVAPPPAAVAPALPAVARGAQGEASPASPSPAVPSSAPSLAPPSSSVPAAPSAQPSTPTQRRVRDAAAKSAATAKKAAAAKKDAAAPEYAELDARRLVVARDLAGTVTAGLNAVLVETVAAQQGLVRDAHPEDILVRVRAAEEHARTAIDDVRRLLTVAAVVPAGGDAVALDR